MTQYTTVNLCGRLSYIARRYQVRREPTLGGVFLRHFECFSFLKEIIAIDSKTFANFCIPNRNSIIHYIIAFYLLYIISELFDPIERSSW